jgi:hypothetical protein
MDFKKTQVKEANWDLEMNLVNKFRKAIKKRDSKKILSNLKLLYENNLKSYEIYEDRLKKYKEAGEKIYLTIKGLGELRESFEKMNNYSNKTEEEKEKAEKTLEEVKERLNEENKRFMLRITMCLTGMMIYSEAMNIISVIKERENKKYLSKEEIGKFNEKFGKIHEKRDYIIKNAKSIERIFNLENAPKQNWRYN